MTQLEFQNKLSSETGLIINAKKMTGSMKEYIMFYPSRKNNLIAGQSYPQFQFEFAQKIKSELGGMCFASNQSIEVKIKYFTL